jgi:hypothetical protein
LRCGVSPLRLPSLCLAQSRLSSAESLGSNSYTKRGLIRNFKQLRRSSRRMNFRMLNQSFHRPHKSI